MANLVLLLLRVGEISADRSDGCLVQIRLEARADAHDGLAEVHGVIEDDDIALHGVESKGLVVQDVTDIQVQIKGVDKSSAARASEDELFERLNVSLLHGASYDFQVSLGTGEKSVAQLSFALFLIFNHELGLDVSARFDLVNLEQISNILEEKDAGEHFAEVHATFHEKVVLGLQEVILLVDVLVNLREQL